MNTDKLARTTFVLDRPTHEMLQVISDRLGRSRSDLIREMVADPIKFMHAQLAKLPPNERLTREDAQAFSESMQQDLVEFIERVAAESGMDRLQ